MAEHFLTEDKSKAVAFIKFVSNNARWNMDTTQAMELNHHLIWFQGMIKKIEDHIFEVVKVHEPVETKKGK